MRLFVDDTREFPNGYQCCRDANTAILMLSAMKFEYSNHTFVSYEV